MEYFVRVSPSIAGKFSRKEFKILANPFIDSIIGGGVLDFVCEHTFTPQGHTPTLVLHHRQFTFNFNKDEDGNHLVFVELLKENFWEKQMAPNIEAN